LGESLFGAIYSGIEKEYSQWDEHFNRKVRKDVAKHLRFIAL